MYPVLILSVLWWVDLYLLCEFLRRPSVRVPKRNRVLAYPIFVGLLVYPILARTDATYVYPSWMSVFHYFLGTMVFQFSLIIFNWLFHPTLEQVKKWNSGQLTASQVYTDLCTCRLTGEWEWNEAMADGVTDDTRRAMWNKRLRVVGFKLLTIWALSHSPTPDFDNLDGMRWSAQSFALNRAWFYVWCYGFGIASFLIMDAASELGLFGWHYFKGVECRPLFGSPLQSRSLRDLWSSQWHPGIKATYKTFAFRPVFGFVLRFTPNKALCAVAGSIAVFAMSGVFHEFCYWSTFSVWPIQHLIFFTSQGCVMLLQEAVSPLHRNSAIINIVTTHIMALAAGPLFVLPMTATAKWHQLSLFS